MSYYLLGAMLECYQTPAKNWPISCRDKRPFCQQYDLLYQFIDKAIVLFCNRFQSCVAVTGGH